MDSAAVMWPSEGPSPSAVFFGWFLCRFPFRTFKDHTFLLNIYQTPPADNRRRRANLQTGEESKPADGGGEQTFRRGRGANLQTGEGSKPADGGGEQTCRRGRRANLQTTEDSKPADEGGQQTCRRRRRANLQTKEESKPADVPRNP
jgi:hypothetical protein